MKIVRRVLIPLLYVLLILGALLTLHLYSNRVHISGQPDSIRLRLATYSTGEGDILLDTTITDAMQIREIMDEIEGTYLPDHNPLHGDFFVDGINHEEILMTITQGEDSYYFDVSELGYVYISSDKYLPWDEDVDDLFEDLMEIILLYKN